MSATWPRGQEVFFWPRPEFDLTSNLFSDLLLKSKPQPQNEMSSEKVKTGGNVFTFPTCPHFHTMSSLYPKSSLSQYVLIFPIWRYFPNVLTAFDTQESPHNESVSVKGQYFILFPPLSGNVFVSVNPQADRVNLQFWKIPFTTFVTLPQSQVGHFQTLFSAACSESLHIVFRNWLLGLTLLTWNTQLVSAEQCCSHDGWCLEIDQEFP